MTENQTKSRRQIIWQGVRLIILNLTMIAACMFVPYGRVDWPQAWVLLFFWLIYYLMVNRLTMRRNPDVVLTRSQSFDRPYQSWDRWILPAYIVITYSLYIVCGLDAGRFGWSDVPLWARWASLLLVIATYILPFWATISNPFASCTVRIQDESGHYTVSSGPYRFVRHPMYASIIPFAIGFPPFLGSYWGFVPGILAVALFVLRTVLEDRFLQKNLEGYQEYAARVRWRLLPGVW